MVPQIIKRNKITRKQHHMVPHVVPHVIPHGAHDISLCTMTNYGILHPIKQLPK
jgi:hypothetical protein